jgi:hypothetical protein
MAKVVDALERSEVQGHVLDWLSNEKRRMVPFIHTTKRSEERFTKGTTRQWARKYCQVSVSSRSSKSR